MVKSPLRSRAFATTRLVRVRMPGSIFILAGILLTALPAAALAAEPRGLTVEDLLRLEEIGAVAVSADGGRVVFERLRPYKEAPEFGRTFLRGKDRAHLYVADVGREPKVRLLFEQERERGYWLGPLAPDGQRVAVFWIERGEVGAGVVELATGKLVPFAFTPEIAIAGRSPLWISNTELVYLALAEGHQPLYARVDRHYADVLPALWRRAWNGTTATKSVLGSGRFRNRGAAPTDGTLLKVDAVNGAMSVLGTGYYTSLTLSPDRYRFAAIRHLELSERDQREDLFRAFPLTAGLEADLVVFDLKEGDSTVCDSCNPIPGTLDWSADGGRLLFLTSDPSGRGEIRQMTLSLSGGRVSSPPLDRLHLESVNGSGLARFRAFWLGDGIAVYAIPARKDAEPGSNSLDPAGRADWYLLRPHRPAVNLTASFPTAPRRPISRAGDAVFMISDGDLWRIAANGTRDNLTAAIVPPLIFWKPEDWASAYAGPPRLNHVPLASTDGSLHQEVFLVNLESGAIDRIADLPPDNELLAVSVEKRAVVARGETCAGSRLELRSDGQSLAALAVFNRDLVGTTPGIPVRIHYIHPDGQSLPAWLLLPPHHESGQRHPTVVSVYPGTVRDGPWRWRTSTFSLFNPHLLAARGYAVLLPSLPLGPEGEPGDPLLGLAEAVLSAVKQAVQSGYTDPNRLGLFGHSYGGYGVLGTIAQTNRFKAAVASASAGLNLISVYGQFDVRRRTAREPVNFLPSIRWAERGQGRMGQPPWEDPQRYRRNSPLFYADRIDTPIMLIHGDLDLWPMTQSEEMFAALYRLQRDAVFVRYWGEGHVPTGPANIRDFWQRIFEWYDLHLNEGPHGTPGPSEERRSDTACIR